MGISADEVKQGIRYRRFRGLWRAGRTIPADLAAHFESCKAVVAEDTSGMQRSMVAATSKWTMFAKHAAATASYKSVPPN